MKKSMSLKSKNPNMFHNPNVGVTQNNFKENKPDVILNTEDRRRRRARQKFLIEKKRYERALQKSLVTTASKQSLEKTPNWGSKEASLREESRPEISFRFNKNPHNKNHSHYNKGHRASVTPPPTRTKKLQKGEIIKDANFSQRTSTPTSKIDKKNFYKNRYEQKLAEKKAKKPKRIKKKRVRGRFSVTQRRFIPYRRKRRSKKLANYTPEQLKEIRLEKIKQKKLAIRRRALRIYFKKKRVYKLLRIFVGHFTKKGKRRMIMNTILEVLRDLRRKVAKLPRFRRCINYKKVNYLVLLLIARAFFRSQLLIFFRRVHRGRTLYRVPLPVFRHKRFGLTTSNLVKGILSRREKTLHEKIVGEILDLNDPTKKPATIERKERMYNFAILHKKNAKYLRFVNAKSF